MANRDPKNQFGKDSQPIKRRGKSERTKILEAMKRQSKSEECFYDYLVKRAFNPEDTFGAPELLKRLAPLPKATLPLVEFEFDESLTPAKQGAQVLKAAALKQIPPDVAQSFIASIASMLKIDEITQIKDEIEEIKRLMGDSDV